MGCGNCGSGASGKPGGCKGNGGCSTGGCNRLNVYNWLNDLPLSDSAKPYPVIEVSFNKGSRKEFFRNTTNQMLEKNDWLAVEGTTGGFDVGQVSLTGELVKLQLKKYGVKEAEVTKRVLHPATEEELEMCNKQKDREPEILTRSRAIARNLKLDMKLCEVEIQADSKKGTFFYTADQRVDFRELIKLYAGDFKLKVEMRQIGARQESGKVGGIGSCGRELCCSTWLTDFKSVNTTAARYQNLSINQTKLSGQCGRLKCCLNFELDTYMDALSVFPDNADHLETAAGVAHLQKRDIFKNLMWYSYSNNNKQYPLSITRVKEILKLNKEGQKAEDLKPVELETRESKAGIKPDMGFVNDVGQITLKALEKNKKKKKPSGNKPKPEGDTQRAGSSGTPGGQPQGSKPQQANRPQQNKQQGGGNPQGNKPQNKGPQGDKPQQGKKPQQPNRPQRPQAEGNQPADAVTTTPQNVPAADGQQPATRPENAGNKRPQQGGNRPQQNRPQGNRPQGNNQPKEAAEGQAPGGEANGDQPAQQGGSRPQQNRPPRRQQRPNRPAGGESGGGNAPAAPQS